LSKANKNEKERAKTVEKEKEITLIIIGKTRPNF